MTPVTGVAKRSEAAGCKEVLDLTIAERRQQGDGSSMHMHRYTEGDTVQPT